MNQICSEAQMNYVQAEHFMKSKIIMKSKRTMCKIQENYV